MVSWRPVFCEGLFLKLSSLSAITLTLEKRAPRQAIDMYMRSAFSWPELAELSWLRKKGRERGREGREGTSSGFSREVLKFIKRNCDFEKEMLEFMKISSQKATVFRHFKKNLSKGSGFWYMVACILRGFFSEIELPLSYNAHSRECADSINWLQDQPFEQGMIIIYMYICWK